MKDNLYIGSESRQRIINGIKRCAEAVGGTMGTGGHNAIIEAIESPGHLVTNDGVTILSSIYFADPLEEMGRKILLEAVNRANKSSGDGSSTATVLTAAILEEGMKYVGEVSPMQIKKSIEACLPIIEESINEHKKDVVVDGVMNLQLLEQVATVSAEDPSIGKMITEIYSKIGKDGIIHWDISKTFNDTYTIGSGITVDGAGLASPYMADIDEKSGGFLNIARLKNSYILLTKQKITSNEDLNGLLQTLFSKDIKELVIFCDEYEPLILPNLVRTRLERGFRVVLIKMPVLWKDWWYEDLSKATGAVVVDSTLGLSLKSVRMEHLGKVDHITVDKENTYLDGIKDVSAHVTYLEGEATDDSKLRASRLNTKTARYFVGASTDSALSYRRLKVEDAIHSAYYAIKDGVVAGGGVALRNCIKDLPAGFGGDILSLSLISPMRHIVENSGGSFDKIPHSSVAGTFNGLDSSTGEIVDMFEAGIVDSTSVVINAVRNAIGVAASVLTGNVVIGLPKQSVTDHIIEEVMKRKPV